ncbi:DUF3566 domain-containing protein [Propionicimonas sp.]|uniref:DUF3566 domain-containing protein n=1 Tax=Propionicimonas sp. TaxID=1955623 RepID=UPI0039E29FF3
MTERQGTAGGATETEHSHPQWSVEGAESSYGDGGLGDTVVRLPRITDEGPAPAQPSAPAPSGRDASGKGGDRPAAVTAPAAPFAGPTPLVDATIAAPAAAMVAAPVAATSEKPKKSGLRRTRKARLRLSKIDPWSVMKTSFLFSIAFGIMFWVAVSVVWTVIVSSGLFDAINEAIVNIISSPNAQSTFRIEDYVNTNKVLGITALLAVINVVISTALGTLTAFLYNLSANILGGLELTLAED